MSVLQDSYTPKARILATAAAGERGLWFRQQNAHAIDGELLDHRRRTTTKLDAFQRRAQQQIAAVSPDEAHWQQSQAERPPVSRWART